MGKFFIKYSPKEIAYAKISPYFGSYISPAQVHLVVNLVFPDIPGVEKPWTDEMDSQFQKCVEQAALNLAASVHYIYKDLSKEVK